MRREMEDIKKSFSPVFRKEQYIYCVLKSVGTSVGECIPVPSILKGSGEGAEQVCVWNC